MLLSFSSRASHIVGGEIYYDYLGGDLYKVTLKLYRDCNGINFDGDPIGSVTSPLGLYVFNGNNVLVDSIAVDFPGETPVPPGLNYACYQPPANVCVMQAVYETVVTLPLNSTGYHLVYQRCCRNAGIVNIVSPGNMGATYTVFVPPRTTTAINNSPRYNNFPPIFICANVPLVFDHSATDLDGDSLVYSLCDAFHGATNACPYYSPGVLLSNCPSSPDAPPYPFVNYASGYSGSYPLSANPALSIDPQTGMLTGTPNQLGQWVVAVCVSEYRNGQLISVNKRDFQFNVVSCVTNIVAAIPTQTLYCNGYIVSYGNNSVNASSFFWDFGVPTADNDTSNFNTPTFAYPDSGTYTVTLIANPGLPCADTAYEQVRVYPLLEPEFVSPPAQCIRGNSYDFSAGGAYTTDATFFWNFGAAATPQTSTVQSPSNITFSSPGIYNVVLTVSQYGCSEPVIHQIEVGALPVPDADVVSTYCGGPLIEFTNFSQNASSFTWDFGEPSSSSNTSNLAAPQHTYSDTGYYYVLLTAENNFCRDSDTVVVHVITELQPDFSPPLTQCLSANSFSFEAGGTYYGPEALFSWNFGSNATPQTSSAEDPSGISFGQPGVYTVSLHVTQRTCMETVIKQIEVLADPLASILPQPPYCGGFNFQFINGSSNSTTYLWDFGVGQITSDTSGIADPSYTYADTGYYNVQLITSNQGICFDTTNLPVHVFPELEPLFTVPDKQCFGTNSFAFQAQGVFQAGAQVLWDFGSTGNPVSASGVNVSGITFSTPGVKEVKLMISQYGCNDSVTHNVRVLDEPVALIDTQDVFCNGFQYAFGNSSQFSDAWSWDFGVTPTSNDTSFKFEPVYTYSDSGSYTVTLIASNEGLCYDTATMLFYIYPLLSPEIFVDDYQQCINGNVFTFDLGGTYSPLTNFLWSFGSTASPDTSILRDPVPVTYSGPGEYPVTLYAYENGCNKSVMKTVYVFPMPAIDFTADGTGCSPFTVRLDDQSFAATEIIYHWDFGDGTTSSLPDPEHVYLNAGIYDVSLTIRTDSGCVDTLSMTKASAITVHQSPVAGFTIDSLTSLETDPTVLVTDQSSYGIQCSIDFGAGLISTVCDTSYTYADTGTYRILQIVYSAEGCTDTMERFVRIPPIFRFYIANAFSPNGDGRNDVFLPEVIGAKTLQLDIYNRWGERIFQGALGEGWDGKYNGRFVQEDVYVYRLFLTDVFDEPHVYKGHVTIVK